MSIDPLDRPERSPRRQSRRAKGPDRSTRIPPSIAGLYPGASESTVGSDSDRPRFTFETLKRDAPAGLITGLMAIPLNIGIALLSDYPIQVALLTVIVACSVSFASYLVRVGNHIGVPGVAAGLAPVLALGVHRYGLETMPWLICLTALFQMLIWKYRLEGYILKVVPPFLIEGLLAGVGLKIALKFLPQTYAITDSTGAVSGAAPSTIVICSVGAALLFLYLYKRFKDSSPGLPYIVVILGSALLATRVPLPMLRFEQVSISFALPIPDFSAIPVLTHVEMLGFSMMLATVDVIEQVMSNAAIEKIDPLGRKTNSNNSLLAVWLSNLVCSFFGGMTNLDGLAKSSTNRMAGAVTKMSTLFVAAVLSVVLAFPNLLTALPEFSLAVLMIFTGWKMIAGLYHAAKHGPYGFGLAMFCGILVFRLGIFEGLLIALALHSFIAYFVYRAQSVPRLDIIKKFVALFSDELRHPHATDTLEIEVDSASGGLVYKSIVRAPSDAKDLNAFIQDWADGINRHSLLGVVATYDIAALLWGTFAKDLRTGRQDIKRYFEHLFELDGLHVAFESGETRRYREIFIRSGSYVFSFRKKGQLVTIPARYSFVCKKETTGWYILEHHSSEFPA